MHETVHWGSFSLGLDQGFGRTETAEGIVNGSNGGDLLELLQPSTAVMTRG